jgi:hypothetical protein
LPVFARDIGNPHARHQALRHDPRLLRSRALAPSRRAFDHLKPPGKSILWDVQMDVHFAASPHANTSVQTGDFFA